MRTCQDEKERADFLWSWHEPGFVQAQNTWGTELFSEPSKKAFKVARSEVVNQEPSPVESEKQQSLCTGGRNYRQSPPGMCGWAFAALCTKMWEAEQAEK